FLWIGGVTQDLVAIAQLTGGNAASPPVHKKVTGQTTGKTGPQLIHALQQRLPLGNTASIFAVGVQIQAIDKTLVTHMLNSCIKRPAAAHTITKPVIEGAYASSRQIFNGCLNKTGVVRHLTEIPSLAVEINTAAIHTIACGSQRRHK